jgi:class 3 adenylate cyclase
MSGDTKLAVKESGLEAFMARHPWSEKMRALAEPLDNLWVFELQAKPSELWPFISDTSRMNRAMGVSRMVFEERDGVLYGRSVNAGMTQEWVEMPWSWTAEREMISVRLYSRGFAHVVRGIFELEPRGDGGTLLRVYFGWIPRGFWQRWLLAIGMSQLQKQFRRLLAEVDQHVESSRSVVRALSVGHSALSTESRARMTRIEKRLISDGVEPDIVRRIAELVERGDDMELHRIQVRPLARRMEVDERTLLGAFLVATRAGLFELSWDVICPHCRGVRAEVKSLGELPAHGDCKVCGIDFDTDGENAIEITFHLHASIRDVPKLFYCSAEPALKDHIRVQKWLEPAERSRVRARLGAGRYRLRVGNASRVGFLQVTESGDDAELPWRASNTVLDVESGPNPTFVLENDTSDRSAFVVERCAWSEDALRPGELLSFQQFRDLFTEEYVGSGIQLSVGRQTILFTDVVGSTQIYAKRGDPGAFADVKKHFVEIYEVVERNHGAVVKTIGDAAMAAFSNPLDALRAAREVHERFPAGRGDLALRVRASLNTGSCIAVNLNTNIDYFGNTVNVAAKLQAFAAAGQVAFPRSALEQPGIRQLVLASGKLDESLEYQIPGTEAPLPVAVWDMNA